MDPGTRPHRLLATLLGVRWRAVLGSLLVAAGALPLVTPNPYHLHVGVAAMLYVALALGLNVVVSCGLLNLGYIAFFAIGAYTHAILSTHWGWSFWSTLLAASLLASLAGLALATASLRSRGDYFALLTLAFGEVVRLVLRNAESLTGGPQGIMHIARPTFFWPIRTTVDFYYFGLAGLAITFCVVHRISVSRLGAAWVAARDNETWLRSAGYDVFAIRVSACVLGALVAGAAGVFFAAWQTFVAPESFTFLESVIVLCMVVLGGGVGGNLMGVLLGAVLLAVLPEVFREFQQYRMIAFGAGMTLIVAFKSTGLIGRSWLTAADESLFRKRPRRAPGPDRADLGHERPGCNALVVTDLAKSYGGVRALGSSAPGQVEHTAGTGFSFSFQSGHIYGIVGLNGAGKTTLFNCLRGLIVPDGGEIRVDETLLSHAPAHRIAAFVGTTFQTCCNLEDMPAWKNVFLALRPLGGPGAVARELLRALVPIHWPSDVADKETAIRFLVDAVGLPAAELGRPVRELSFESRRKVELAKAFAPGSPILLLDEPTAGLNDEERARFIELIRSLSSQRLVVVIEHNHAALGRLADQILFMEAGNIGEADGQRTVGTYEAVMGMAHVREVYLGTRPTKPASGRAERAAESILDLHIEHAGYVEGAPVLDDVELTLARGSIVGLVGLNGAGKTTLLRALINSNEIPFLRGVVGFRRSGASVRLVDTPRELSLPTHRIAREGVVLVRQENKLFGSMSVAENLGFGAIGTGRLEDAQSSAAWFAEEVLARAFRSDAGLRAVLARRSSQLSGGQQQLLAIGRAFVATGLGPRSPAHGGREIVFLLDEPTSGLQPSLVHLVFETVERLRSSFGVTFLITEQEREIEEICDEVYCLETGRIVP